LRDLVSLRDAGVDVQNHGWSHAHHGSLSPEESAREIREGRAWLARELGVDGSHFAVPFGDTLPSERALGECATWLIADPNRPPGVIAPRVVNRETPDYAVQRLRRYDRKRPALGLRVGIVERFRQLLR
jgi:peptidoglycan/xylan/chitin deacetylase (PgdA/CDA1 family)